MSKDIRSFFKLDNSKKRKNDDKSSSIEKKKNLLINHLIAINDDDDADTKKSDKKKKRRIIDSDEDDNCEEIAAKKASSKKKKEDDPKPKVEDKKEVKDIKSLFGGPVKRSERPKPIASSSTKSPSKSSKLKDVDKSRKNDDEVVLITVDEGKISQSELKKDSRGKENLKKNDSVEKSKDKPSSSAINQEKQENMTIKEESAEKVGKKELKGSQSQKPKYEKLQKLKSPVKPKLNIDKSPKKSQPLPQSSSSSQPSQKTTSPVTLKPKNSSPIVTAPMPKPPAKQINLDDLSFVDKYKPTSMKQIIGQQGPQGNANKLRNWLLHWHRNHGDPSKKTKKTNPYAKDNDGSSFRAALLSGSPGVGKSTTASLVCKEFLFDAVEFNASDTRSKRLLKEEVSQLLSNQSLKGYMTGDDQVTTKRHVLIMDEVDGMAGNEDRGGIAELIQLIKESHIPIICLCNDRSHPKIRSLVNYCYDLRFYKPSTNQIRSAMMSICFKEGIKMEQGAIDAIINGTGNDVRQTLNHLALYSADKDSKLSTDNAKRNARMSEKDIKIGPWDVIRKVFSASEQQTMSFNDKCDLFFYDYNIAPLFVQENYLSIEPSCPKSEVLDRIAKTADSLSLGDTVEKKIRSNMAWSLLPTQAIFSSVLPGEYMKGSFKSQAAFPSWLGRNAKSQKRKRLAQELHDHTRIVTSGSRLSVRLDYAQFLVQSIITPLKEKGLQGVPEALEVIKDYRLLRDDIESLLELTTWGTEKNPWEQIDSKVKAALTRTYNKEVQAYSYSVMAGVKKKKSTAVDAEGLNLDEGDDAEQSDENEEEESIEKSSMIKVKKTASAKEPKPSTSKATTSKAKAKGKK